MSTPISVDSSIEPTSPQQINIDSNPNPNTLIACSNLITTPYEQLEDYKKLPNIFKTTITPIALKFSTIICKIDNLKLNIDDISTHLAANTAPDYIIKQFKNILKKDKELILKQMLIKNKLNQLFSDKIEQANELIQQFNLRSNISTPQIFAILRTVPLTGLPDLQPYWDAYLDYHIGLKLIEFRRKQALDHEIKAKKRILFNEKIAKDAIPVVITQKMFKNLNLNSKNLVNKPRARPRSNTTNKQATSRTTNPKSDPSNPRKVFQPRKQKKSPTVPPKRKNAGKKN
jgi:hypothetical protein